MTNGITFHHATLPVNKDASLDELLNNALINHITGHTEAGLHYEGLAKRHPEYTDKALWCTLAGVAKRQLAIREDLDGAIRTLQRGLPAGLRHSGVGGAIMVLMIIAFQNELTNKQLSADSYKAAEQLLG